jgi:hypothetical protein
MSLKQERDEHGKKGENPNKFFRTDINNYHTKRIRNNKLN